MAADLNLSLVSEAVRSLEVRWIFPGKLGTGAAQWFGRFPARTESREDSYLLDPQLRGLSVKLRAPGTLEVKAYSGSPGILEMPDRARGRMESWQKWSFPFSPPSPGRVDSPGWLPVRKNRHVSRFSLASPQDSEPNAGVGQELRCEVELAEVRTRGEDWWTLGFEATGLIELLRKAVEETARLVFAQAPPGLEPSLDESRSYAEWLSQLSRARPWHGGDVAQHPWGELRDAACHELSGHIDENSLFLRGLNGDRPQLLNEPAPAQRNGLR